MLFECKLCSLMEFGIYLLFIIVNIKISIELICIKDYIMFFYGCIVVILM